ncbi:hypothetical protein ACIRL0_00525 [Streptomyces sp. NPDC102365]|uniref:hypothetical protein n=1 Tax=Streptomyces sp. NPDC102365 TaxID=3366162 RepID=UPI003830CF83
MPNDPTTQQQYVALAWNAVSRAAQMARQAEDAANQRGRQDQVAPLAAAGALWADTARAYVAILAVLPEPADPTDTDPEA